MYKVLIDTLHHNGRRRVPGELIELDEADAAPLIKVGAVEAVEAVAAVAANPTGSPGHDDPEQNPIPAESDVDDASTSDVQEQPLIFAAANNDAGSAGTKGNKKESKSIAK